MQVTKNFKLSELEFSDAIPPELVANAVELLKNLQIIRDHFQNPYRDWETDRKSTV